MIFLSTHGPGLHRRCVEWLRARGYRVRPIVGEDADTTSELLCTPDGRA